MDDPVIKKIDQHPNLVGVAAIDDKVLGIDASQLDPAQKTVLISMNQISIHTASQLAADVVETLQIKDSAVTEAKLGTIKRTVVIRFTSPDDGFTTGSTTNFFPFPVTLNNFIVVDARMNLSVASTSGSVTVELLNQGGTMTTLTLAANTRGMSSSGTISETYNKALTNNFLGVNCTAAGTGARGLSITLVLQGVPA